MMYSWTLQEPRGAVAIQEACPVAADQPRCIVWVRDGVKTIQNLSRESTTPNIEELQLGGLNGRNSNRLVER